jgi:5-methylcytosine-specific restriction endonuclease McrA
LHRRAAAAIDGMNAPPCLLHLCSAAPDDRRNELREAVSYRCKGKCERCGNFGSELHHRKYERLGRERPTDLEWLCAECHRRIHAPS